MKKPIVFLDFESTGTDVASDRIVQVSMVKKFPDGKIETRNVFVNPTIPIPIEASEVHGITDEMVATCPTFKQIAKSLTQYISGCDLAGYNIVNYDIPLLKEELIRADVDFSFDDMNFIDLMVIYMKLHKRDLSACFKHYTGKELEGAHNAMNDTLACADIFDAMKESEKDLQDMDLDQMASFSFDKSKMVDFAGKFVRNDQGEICFNFGDSKGVPVTKNMGFVDWMLNKNFTADTKDCARRIKQGLLV
jgi:DNA polymerase III subunit epsilon